MPQLTRREMVAAVLAGTAAASIESAAAPVPGEALPSAKATLPLYPGPIPGAIEAPDEEATRDPKEAWVYRQNISRPTLTVFLPAKTAGATPAVVICPGGSYRGVSIDKEGYSVAQAFNRFGVAGIVLKYRTPNPRHMKETFIGPLQDAQQALHVVHQRAREWNIDRKRIGIVGFSAGGHLAASASTLFAKPVLPNHSAQDVRPAFSVLIYPVISMRDELTHRDSRAQLSSRSSATRRTKPSRIRPRTPSSCMRPTIRPWPSATAFATSKRSRSEAYRHSFSSMREEGTDTASKIPRPPMTGSRACGTGSQAKG